MVAVHFSITSADFPGLAHAGPVQMESSTVAGILERLNELYPGLKPHLVDDEGRIRSCALLVKNVTVTNDGRILLEKNVAKQITTLAEPVGEGDNLLISLFDVQFIDSLLTEGLALPEETYHYEDEEGRPKRDYFRSYVLPVQRNLTHLENVPAFVDSAVEIRQLMFELTDDENFMRFSLRPGADTLDCFVREDSRVIPAPLAPALYGLLADSDEVSPQAHLRLFQEDALFFILAKLWRPDCIREKALLLSIPTGGGKTEAFVFPLISHILARKAQTMKSGARLSHSVKALVLYPTKALANDQAKRLAEILQRANAAISDAMPSELAVSIGIFTGDTVDSRDALTDPMGNFLSLFQTCPACDHSDFELATQVENGKEVTVQCCKECGHRMTYARVTRADIFNAPPDILITNPDTLNYHIQVPTRQATLLQHLEVVVFDEVHEYNGIFGCNVAHLLRRIEARRNGKAPFYVGLSATIGNAQDLAALLFNVPPKEVLYVRHTQQRPYLRPDTVARRRYHMVLTPNMHAVQKRLRAYPLTATINIASALGHAIRDPQFRKILIFANFKADHDKLSFEIPENERDYVGLYRDNIRAQLRRARSEGCLPRLAPSDRKVVRQVGRWYEWEDAHVTMHPHELAIGWHRGALEMEERVRAVNRFASLSEIRTGGDGPVSEYPTDIMVATKTLELGVDIGNVSIVINSSAPFSNNDYVQRTGRGGRRKDSIALTIINPNNAIDAYMREHFYDQFVSAERVFEDAPIIASNELIMRGHILARVLDYLASEIEQTSQITVGDWLGHRLLVDGRQLDVREDPVSYAEALFDRIFPGSTFDTFAQWFTIEAQVLQGNGGSSIEPYVLTREWVVQVLLDACEKLRSKTAPGVRERWDASLSLLGFDAVLPELRPSLRGTGKSVGLYLRTRNQDVWKDEISRDRAIYQNPPGSYQSQGRNLFVIEDIKRDDQDCEDEIKGLLVDNPEAYEYFVRHFPDSSLQAPPAHAFRWRLRTPAELRVRHFPARYYCSNPECGSTYTSAETTDELKCLKCNWPLHQLTRVYRCPRCSALAEPPVPKLCINPECVRAKLDRDQGRRLNTRWNLRIAVKKAIRDKSPAPLRGFFRFRTRPNLEWECLDCRAVISFHNRQSAKRLGTPMGLPDERSLDGPNAHLVISWLGLFRPELPIYNKRAYVGLECRLNGYDCPDHDNCPAHWRGGLTAVNLPRFQTDVVQFHIARKQLGSSRNTRLGEIHFFSGDVVSIAERYAVSDPKEDENETSEVIRRRIFDEGELYATHFAPHMFGLCLRDRLDSFLSRTPCSVANCSDCQEILALELGDIYRPQMHLAPRYVENEMPVRPDPRAVWCETNRGGGCERINCRDCGVFDHNALRRFAVLHTLKHGILWALPKYTGLDVGSFKGVVNPGFLSRVPGVPNEVDLLIIDTNDGGSGAVHLVNRWWDHFIEPMAIEILKLAALSRTDQKRANLNLPYTCSWFNRSLCPVLAARFISEL